MSIEEIKKTLSTMIFAIDCPEPKISIGDMADVREALSMAIRSLEAWEKLWQEIEQLQKDNSNHYGNEVETAKYDAYDDCLDVIDKHLKEVENDLL